MDRFFADNDLDALAMPTSATSATTDWAGTTFCDVGANTGVPTVSLPAGFTSTGAAVGLELAAPRSQDAMLLSMSFDYEQATLHRVAPASVPELLNEIAVDPAGDPVTPVVPTAEAPTLAATGADDASAAVGFALCLLAGGLAMTVLATTRRGRFRRPRQLR